MNDVECVVAVDRGVATGVQKFDVDQVKAGAPGGDRIIRVVTDQRTALASMFSSSLLSFVACYPRKEVHTKRRTV